MGTLQFKNNASTTLSGSINNSQTTITVNNASAFPALAGSDYFYATMYEVSGSVEINVEIVKVTATSGNLWTVARAQDGTSARARDGVTTCYVEQRMTAASAQLMLQIDNNLSDLASVATARTNLGLGTMATQNANNVAITGGSISGVSINGIDSTTTISDNADTTKKVAFEVSGVTTGTTRTLTIPNASGTIALLSDLSAGYQPLDSDLTAFAALAANGLVARTGTGTVAVRTITPPVAGMTITNGDGVSGNPTLALANDLAGVEGLSTTGFVRRTAADTWAASALVDADLPSALTGKTYNALTLTALAIGFSVAGGTTSKTLTVSNSITLAGTDGTTITLPSTSGTVALNNQTMFIGTTSVAINRTTGALSLTGVNIDGSAGSAATATTATKATNLVGGNNTTMLGAIHYQSDVDVTTLLAPNTTATKRFLSQTGTGTNGAAPAWATLAASDVGLGNVENTALSTWAGSANIVTVGTVATGTWNATAISIAKGGTGQTTAAAGFNALSPITTLGDLIYGSGASTATRLAGNTTTTRRFLRQTGDGTNSAAPAWDTLLDADVPSTLTGKTYNALTLTAAATGFTIAGGTTSKTLTMSNTLTLAGTDGSTLNVGAGGTLGSAAFTASTAYAPAAGSASIVTLGTITSGTWTGSTIGLSYGGTGATTAAAARTNLGLVIGTDVPGPTGGGASGTWGINITGNAATVTNGIYTTNIGSYAPTPTGGGASGTWGINITGNAATVTNGITTSNIGSYAPTLTGGGASGNWGINVTGNSATTSQRTFSNVRTDGINRGSYGSISVAGSTNGYSGIDFGDAAVTFMVNTTSKLSGVYKDNNAWIWYFDGSGALAVGTVPWGSITGRPTAVSSFSNDSGYITSGGRAYPRIVGGGDFNVNWSGQGGQPSWLIGGNDGTNFYVYNPSNFSVSYAASAGSASSASIASQVSINYSNDSNSTYQLLWGSGNSVYGTAGVTVNPSNDYVYANSFNCSGWFRSGGASGWYNESYGGGIWMEDTTWVKVYSGKSFYVGNSIAATGDVIAHYSDMRLKTKVGGIENAVEKVEMLSGFQYVNNDLAKQFGYTSEATQIGLSAQQVEAVFPELVKLAPFDMEADGNGGYKSKSGENYKTVSYERLVPVLVEAIKELSARLKKLESVA